MSEINIFDYEKNLEKLYEEQKENLPLLRKKLEYLGYDIINKYRDDDGWCGGFLIDYFTVNDRRNEKKLTMRGSDNNDAIYYKHDSGGWELLYRL